MYVCARRYVHMCAYTHICEHIHMCANAWGNQRSPLGLLPQVLATLLFETAPEISLPSLPSSEMTSSAVVSSSLWVVGISVQFLCLQIFTN